MRNIAILSDGYSDYLVFKKFISVLLNKHADEQINDENFLNLEFLNITNSIVKYLHSVSKTNDYSFETDEAKELIKNLVGVYYGCYSKCDREFDISNKSIIIISTDAERLLLDRQSYFNQWAYNIKGILYYSIEKFYEKMVTQGYTYEYLPYYIPLVPFPSSEIIVASCMYDFSTNNMREHRPTPSLKQKVYNSDNIPHAINSGNLYKVLEEHITPNAIQNIYKEIPEARMLIHTLSS